MRLIACLWLPLFVQSQNVTIKGLWSQWHKITFDFIGPYTEEQAAPSPFATYRLTVTFTHSGSDGETSYDVPGFFAADGNAAHTGATGGNVWRCHFSPPHVGMYHYRVAFLTGDGIILDPSLAGESAGYMDGLEGDFVVGYSNKTGRDARAMGLLQYVDERYLWLAGSEEYFLKIGTDSPENLLAYADFDNTPNTYDLRKEYIQHIADWREGDPTWADGRGKGLIGAVNYLSWKGLNMLSFLTFNVQGDDMNVFPYTSVWGYRIDVSKTDQWEIVFEHANSKGIGLHVKTQETENEHLHGNSTFDVRRAIYYRELIARFGHHPLLIWNLGEETKMPSWVLLAAAEYIRKVDPYGHSIDVHTYPDWKNDVYPALMWNNASKVTGASLQCVPETINAEINEWIQRSAESPHPFVVSNDEQNPYYLGVQIDDIDPDHDFIRRHALWGSFLAGGGGVEFYFGWGFRWHQTGEQGPIIGNDDEEDVPYSTCSDITCEDFHTRDKMFSQAFLAWRFMTQNDIPFWEMNGMNHLTPQPDDFVFAKLGDIYLIYTFTNTTEVLLEVASGVNYSVRYWNPKTGGDMIDNGQIIPAGEPGGNTTSRTVTMPMLQAAQVGSPDVLIIVRRVDFAAARSLLREREQLEDLQELVS
ncbi:unnamed protein product [Vitrella brassicaformis CCMP3155]|uniref:DUF5060 domain-containing protein n=2 Tax=Vitrella brassicaformis TaxID=1169539 RepID=A0A0G4E861_VITBC|nr:unnamed protein product [Vitrella brassicaformis CCMP3155]|eukprot:CEL91678.1 unnamed protein product [Vitrella brassicaformis CCMP3155]